VGGKKSEVAETISVGEKSEQFLFSETFAA
jgi:hypothetical protein